MTDDYQKIAVTPHAPLKDEAAMINTILDEGWNGVHLRHPLSDAETVAAILDDIRPENLSRVRLHDHFHLAKSYPVGGLHLNSRNPSLSSDFNGSLSRSCHSVDEICRLETNTYDYVTLSPLFDSISKPGYYAMKLKPEELEQINSVKIMAMGGITPERIKNLRCYNFAGVCVLGFLFNKLGTNWKPALVSRLNNFK